MSGTLRFPRAEVNIGGRVVPFVDLSATQTRHKKGDTAKVITAMKLLDPAWLASASGDLPFTIAINGTQVFNGHVSTSSYDWAERTVTVEGRDAAAKLMDAQSQEKWQNKKPHEIVQEIAQRHGIQTEVDQPSDQAGKIYSDDYDALSNRHSEWSVINWIADHFGMIAYITGGKLYYKNHDEQLPTVTIQYRPPTPQEYESGNFIKLHTTRNHVLGRKTKVNVHSHNHRKKEVYHANEEDGDGGDEPLIYHYHIPQISQQQGQRIAKAKMAEIKSHEMKVDSLEIPGDESINARVSIQLTGTGTAFDQSYDAGDITHTISVKGGYVTTIHVKNKKGQKGGAD